MDGGREVSVQVDAQSTMPLVNFNRLPLDRRETLVGSFMSLRFRRSCLCYFRDAYA